MLYYLCLSLRMIRLHQLSCTLRPRLYKTPSIDQRLSWIFDHLTLTSLLAQTSRTDITGCDFYHYAVWNSLPRTVLKHLTLTIFMPMLKIHIFTRLIITDNMTCAATASNLRTYGKTDICTLLLLLFLVPPESKLSFIYLFIYLLLLLLKVSVTWIFNSVL